MTSLASLVGALALAIVPTQARDATRAEIKVRGASDALADVQAGQLDTKVFEGRTRVAVLPFDVPKDDATLASQRTGAMDSVLADLRYVPTYLVADRTEVFSAIARQKPQQNAIDAIASIGTDLGVKVIISGSINGEGDNLAIELKLYTIDGRTAKLAATSKAAGPKSQIYALGDEALLSLLSEMKATPAADRIEEIKKVPTRNFTARMQADLGFALLDQVAGKDRLAADVIGINKMALEHAKAALKADRNYVIAHMLRASCLFNLDATTDLKDCLEQGLAKNEPRRIDSISSLELEGDYLTFHDGKYAEAVKKYESILAFDPGNLHSLWSLTGIYSGDYGAKEFANDPKAKDKAGRFAAQLVFSHPGSAASEIFRQKPSQP